jgi:hypothetical protein
VEGGGGRQRCPPPKKHRSILREMLSSFNAGFITHFWSLGFRGVMFDSYSCHIGSVPIGVEYSIGVELWMFIYFLLFCMGKLYQNELQTCNLQTSHSISYKYEN